MKVLALLVGGAAAILSRSKIPITETVEVEGTQVYGQQAGHSTLNTCQQFARQFVKDEAKPEIKVCGTGTKVKVYLRNRCEDYHHYTEEIGTCDTASDSSSCETASPSTQSWMQTAQSYEIVQC